MSLVHLLQLTPEGALTWTHPSWLDLLAEGPGKHFF